MNLFKRKNASAEPGNQSALAEMALRAIHDGVVIVDKTGIVKFINPAAGSMTGYGANAVGVDYGLIMKLESKEGRELSDAENPLVQAVKTGQPLEKFQANLMIYQTDKRIPVAITVLPADGLSQDRVITFKDITKELQEEGEQMEFISTASHEMRTPVATIDGYLSLALNPQTATLDERAKGYLTAAQTASKHLGKLFQDLLDVTKLDDGRIRPNFVPVEMVGFVREVAKGYEAQAAEAKLDFSFGSGENEDSFDDNRRLQQLVYGFIDENFMREILDNLIENAIKYTPAGGSIYVNVRGDGDRVLINVTDTGIGISADDLAHIFQKFYRADNSDTRTIGGNGLGLYLVKQRTEAMGGKVWAESAFGEGSTFFVSLPRLSEDEYEKRMIVVKNAKMQEELVKAGKEAVAKMPAKSVASAPASIATATPAAPVASAAPASVLTSTPTPSPVAAPTPAPAKPPSPPVATAPVAPLSSTAPPPISPPVAPAKPQEITSNQINNNLNGEAK